MNLKYIIFALITTCLMSSSYAISNSDVNVKGYYKNNGTYVPQHYRSNPNSTTNDNWSTKGNTNPYTGKKGTQNPDSKWNSNKW